MLSLPFYILRFNSYVQKFYNAFLNSFEKNSIFIPENYIVGMYGNYEIYKTLFGPEYFNVTSYKLDYTDVQGKVVYRFNNLFHGDDEKCKFFFFFCFLYV